MERIVQVAEALKALRYRGRVALYVYNEPMRDKRLLEIIRLFGAAVPKATIMVSTNGDYLRRPVDLEALYTAGCRQVLVNIYSAADGCGSPKRQAQGVERAVNRAALIAQWMRELGCQSGGVYGTAPAGARVGMVECKFGVTAEDRKLAKFELQNRSGNIDWFMPATTGVLPNMCTRPFRVLNINWRGDAVLCCNDYHAVTAFGNLKDSTLVDLWNKPGFHRYRLLLQNKNRNAPLCDACSFKGGAYPHMVQHVTFGDKEDAKILKVHTKRG